MVTVKPCLKVGNKLFRNEFVLFLLIFICSIIFYLFNIRFSDLWSDEIYTKSMLDGSLPDLYEKFKNDLHPPLYYLALRLFTSLVGLNAFTLRFFSVVGVLATLLLGYFAGKRVFGKPGSLYFCLLIIAIPMLAAYSHQARMYTWAAFASTGLFIYAYLYLSTGKNTDLLLLFIFTLLAIYIHYYSMAAAAVTNLFVFLYLLMTKNRKWLYHLISMVVACLLFLPWVFMFFIQIQKVQHAFWAPEVNFNVIVSCFTQPFTEQFWKSNYAIALTILSYMLITITVFRSFSNSFSGHRLIIWLSLTIFTGTIFIATVISLVSQPILFSRYIVIVSTMLAIPIVIFFIHFNNKWLRITLMLVIIFLGIRISVSNYYFSYGPYKQTIDYITATYPEIKKVLHITEITAGPMMEYNGDSGLDHYWLKAEMSNVDAFKEIHQHNRPQEFLQQGETFCAVRFHNLELNKENLDLVISESELIKTDTVRDNKVSDGIFIQVYLLKYTRQ